MIFGSILAYRDYRINKKRKAIGEEDATTSMLMIKWGGIAAIGLMLILLELNVIPKL